MILTRFHVNFFRILFIIKTKLVKFIAFYCGFPTTLRRSIIRASVVAVINSTSNYWSVWITVYVVNNHFLAYTWDKISAPITRSEERSEEHTSELQSRPHL